MKIGTFRCWLWGHRFATEVYKGWVGDKHYEEYILEPTDVCQRCGILKEELYVKEE